MLQEPGKQMNLVAMTYLGSRKTSKDLLDPAAWQKLGPDGKSSTMDSLFGGIHTEEQVASLLRDLRDRLGVRGCCVAQSQSQV